MHLAMLLSHLHSQASLWLMADAEWFYRSGPAQLDATHVPILDLGSNVAAGVALSTLSSLADGSATTTPHRERHFTPLFNVRHAAS